MKSANQLPAVSCIQSARLPEVTAKRSLSLRRLGALLIFALGAFAVPTSPAQAAATVVSVSAPSGFYKDGDILSITVEFTEVVTVTIVDSFPVILFTLTDTSTPSPTYSAGSGTNSLTFTHTVGGR